MRRLFEHRNVFCGIAYLHLVENMVEADSSALRATLVIIVWDPFTSTIYSAKICNARRPFPDFEIHRLDEKVRRLRVCSTTSKTCTRRTLLCRKKLLRRNLCPVCRIHLLLERMISIHWFETRQWMSCIFQVFSEIGLSFSGKIHFYSLFHAMFHET